MANLERKLAQALRAELRERTGTVKGECECCGGGLDGLPYHPKCCAKPRALLSKMDRQP